jgi:hypothetical protein
LEEFWKDKYSPDPKLFQKRLIALWSRDLARTCGKTYESVVTLCLGDIATPASNC